MSVAERRAGVGVDAGAPAAAAVDADADAEAPKLHARNKKKEGASDARIGYVYEMVRQQPNRTWNGQATARP